MARKIKMDQAKDEIDLTPMIDVIFLIIIFFILAGKITSDLRPQSITVPPTKTAMKKPVPEGWEKIVINVKGNTQTGMFKGKPPRYTIFIGDKKWTGNAFNSFEPYIQMRKFLDRIYLDADKYADPNPTGLQLPKVAVEIRADADTEYRVIQEVQQVLSDTIDPGPDKDGKHMMPKVPDAANMKPFIDLRFTSQKPD